MTFLGLGAEFKEGKCENIQDFTVNSAMERMMWKVLGNYF